MTNSPAKASFSPFRVWVFRASLGIWVFGYLGISRRFATRTEMSGLEVLQPIEIERGEKIGFGLGATDLRNAAIFAE